MNPNNVYNATGIQNIQLIEHTNFSATIVTGAVRGFVEKKSAVHTWQTLGHYGKAHPSSYLQYVSNIQAYRSKYTSTDDINCQLINYLSAFYYLICVIWTGYKEK